MAVSVTLDGLTFYGDGSDLNWIYTHLQGWYSGAPIRGDSADNPNSDGQSPIDLAYRSARALKFTGYLWADDTASAIQKWMKFAAIQSSGKPIILTVNDPFGTLSCMVSVNGAPEVSELTNDGAEVTVSLIAYDPVKYGTARQVVTGLPMSGGGLEYPLHTAGALATNGVINPSPQVNDTGYTVVGASVTGVRTAGVGVSGGYGFRATWSAGSTTATDGAQIGSGADLSVKVTPGDTTRFSLYASSSAAPTLSIRYAFYDAANTPLIGAGITDSATVTLVANAAAVRLVSTPILIPAGADHAVIRAVWATGTNWVTGNTLTIDRISTRGDLAYFDGVILGTWNGAAYASTSSAYFASGGPMGALYYGSVGTLGRVTLTNAGTAKVWPILTVTGGLTNGFYVQRLDTGQVVRYDRVVPDGGTLTIDFRTGEVLIDGVSDGSTYLTRYEFFSIGPGETFDVQLNAINGSTGTPTATFTLSDGYW